MKRINGVEARPDLEADQRRCSSMALKFPEVSDLEDNSNNGVDFKR